MNISEEAVDAAMAAPFVSCDGVGQPFHHACMACAWWSERASIEAAAPALQAQALREVADELARMVDSTDTSAYTSAGRDIIGRIQERAAALEGEAKR